MVPLIPHFQEDPFLRLFQPNQALQVCLTDLLHLSLLFVQRVQVDPEGQEVQ